MKKTDKTALTAAAFAAAINIIPLNSSAYDPAGDPVQDVYGPPVYFETVTKYASPQPDYGPPPTWRTEVSSVTNETTTTETETEFYGVYGPPPINGDLNNDRKLDSYDLIIMRQLLAKKLNNEPYIVPYSDMNGDYDFSVADLVTLNRFLLGYGEYITKETETTPTASEVPDVTTITEEYPVPVYGPPAWFGEDK